MRNEKVSKNHCCIPAPMHENFRYQNFLKRQIFCPCEAKKFNVEQWHPLRMSKIFRYPKFSETLMVRTKFWGTVRQKKFQRKKWYPPPHLLSIIFFQTRKILKHKGSLTKFFGPVKQKNFDKTLMPPPLMHKIFRYQIFFWNTEGFSYEVFRHCETKIFRQKIVISPYAKFFSIPEVFSYTELFQHNFLVLWD